MQVTDLVVFLPPALGAYVLFQHHTKVSSSLSSADGASTQDDPHTLRIHQSSLLTPPAVISRQAEHEPSSSTAAPSVPAPPPRTVYAGFEPGPVKGKPSPQVTVGTGKGPKDDSSLAQDPPFFTVAQQKGKGTAPQRGKERQE